MLIRQKKRQSWALFFVGLLLFTQLVSLAIPTQVHALLPDAGGSGTADTSPYGQASTTQRAEVWTLARATAKCLNEDGYTGSLEVSNSWTGNDPTSVGEFTEYLVEGDSSHDAKVRCDDVMKKTLNELGVSPEQALCAMGYSRDSGGTCIGGSGNYVPPKNWSKSAFKDAWNAYFSKTWLGGKSASDVLTSGMKYYIYFYEFMRECGTGTGFGDGLNISPWKTGDDISGKKAYRLPMLVNGSIQDSYVTSSDHDESSNVAIDGWGLLDNAGGQNDVLNCGSLANNLRTNAPAFTTEVATDATAGKNQSTGALSNGSSSDREGSCEANNGGFAWVGCALLEVMDGIVGFLDSQIRSLLTVQTGALDQDGGLKKAWGVMRNFAYLILIPMMLIMVIGTAVGFGPFDAYTVKKALPRMVSAVIFMSISYYLCLFLINVSNDVGKGIFNLITLAAPGGQVNSLTDVFGGGAGTLFSGLSAGGLVIAGFTGAVTWGVLGSFALVTVVALLIGYVVLVIRQVLIIMLLVLSPIAILVWIFPGNDKLWNIWKTTFTALLMMFPLIMILIAAGRFFAATADTTYQGLTGTFIKLIAYIAPYFFIPATFKYGLGVFGNIAGMINDRGRGIFDRQRKFRETNRANARQSAREGNRFAGGTKSNFRGRLNRGIAGSLNAPGAIMDSGNTFSPGNWRAATRGAMKTSNLAEIERNMKENQAYQPWIFDDGMNKAASKTDNADQLRKYLIDNNGYKAGSRDLEDAVNNVETVRRSMSPDAFRAMTTRQALAGGTAYKSSDNPAAPRTAAGEAWADVARASVNDEAMASYLVANGRSEGMKAGRIDYAGAGFGTTLGVVNKMRKELRETGNISQATIEAATREIHDDVYKGQGGASLVHSSMKPDAIKDMAPQMVHDVEMARSTGDEREFTQSLASLAAVYDGLQGSSPAKAKVIADNVLNQQIDIATLKPEMRIRLAPALRQVDAQGNESTRISGTITYQQAIDGLRGNNEFKQMRREYSSEVERTMGQQPPEPGTPIGGIPGAS